MNVSTRSLARTIIAAVSFLSAFGPGSAAAQEEELPLLRDQKLIVEISAGESRRLVHRKPTRGFVFVWASSETFEPVLTAILPDGAERAGSTELGGRTTSMLILQTRPDTDLRFTVSQAPGSEKAGRVTVEMREAPETAATIAAHERAQIAIAEIRAALKKDARKARKLCRQLLKDLKQVEGFERSGFIQEESIQYLMSFAQETGDRRLRSECLSYFADFIKATRPTTSPALHSINSVAGVAHMDVGKFQEAEALFRESLDNLDRDGPQSEVRATVLLNLSIAVAGQGRFKESAHLDEQVVAIREATLAEDDPKLIRAWGNLAASYANCGDKERAIPLERKVVAALTELVAQNHPSLLRARNNLALSLAETGKLEKSHAILESIYKLAIESLPADSPDRWEVARAYGRSCCRLQQALKGVKILEDTEAAMAKALPAFHPKLIALRCTLCTCEFEAGRPLAASKKLKRLLRFMKLSMRKNDPRLITARGNYAAMLTAVGNYDESLLIQKEVIDYYRAQGVSGRRDLVRSLKNLGSASRTKGDFKSAEKALSEAVKLSREIDPDEQATAVCEVELAATLQQLGRVKESAKLALKARQSLKGKTMSDFERDRVDFSLAGLAQMHGDLEYSRDVFARVVSRWSQTHPAQSLELALARCSLGAVYVKMGLDASAREELEKSIAVLESVMPEDFVYLQIGRINLGAVLARHGELEASKVLIEDARPYLAAAYGDQHPYVLAADHDLVTLLERMGEYDEANARGRDLLDRAEAALSEDHPDLQVFRRAVASSLMKSGLRSEGLVLFEKAVAAFEKTRKANDLQLSEARLSLAAAYLSGGDKVKAAKLLELAMDRIHESFGSQHPNFLIAKLIEANLLVEQKQFAAALEAAQQARAGLERAMEAGAPDRVSAVAIEAWLQCLAGDEKAVGPILVKLAAEIGSSIQAMESNLAPRRMASIVARARQHIDSLLSLRRFDGSGTFDERFALVAEMTRSSVSSSYRMSRFLTEDSEVHQQAVRLRRDILKAAEKVSVHARDPKMNSLLRGEIEKKEAAQNALRALIKESSAAGNLLTTPTVSRLAAGLAEGDLGIGYWRYISHAIDSETLKETKQPRYLAYVVTPGATVELFDLGAAEEVEKQVRKWRAVVGATGGRGAPGIEINVVRGLEASGKALRARILDPILAKYPKVKRLLVAPDDALHVLPLDALPQGKGVVGDQLEVRVVNALVDLTRPVARSAKQKKIAIIGDVSYSAPSGNGKPSGFSHPVAGVSRGALRDHSGSSFAPLPNTRKEALAVAKLFREAHPGEDPVILMGEEANRTRLFESIEGLRYLHIATHGWFSSHAPAHFDPQHRFGSVDDILGFAPMTLCGLAMAGANSAADHPQNLGVVTAEEISCLDLSGCQLAVLSACETALGLRRSGRGVASLRAALHAAGVRNAITSLWKVPDEATAMLMTRFYGHLWADKMEVGEALRAAKRELRTMRDSRTGKLRFKTKDWAAWVLSGPTSPARTK